MPVAAADTPDVIWFDGSRSPRPQGRLLTDNAGFWGDSVLTGVTYSYPTEPTKPKDIFRNDESTFGRRLLDGQPDGNWHVPVGVLREPLVVVFDFNRPGTFHEVDIVSDKSDRLSIRLAVRGDEQGEWEEVYRAPLEAQAHKPLRRVRLDRPAKGRYLRVEVQGDKDVTYLSEVLVWGDAVVSEEMPAQYQPTRKTTYITGSARSSIPGDTGTSFSDQAFRQWLREVGKQAASQKAIWSHLPTWDMLSNEPILPERSRLAKDVSMELSRNGMEYAALALTSTDWRDPTQTEVSLSPFKRVRGEDAAAPASAPDTGGRAASGTPDSAPAPQGLLRVGGAIESRKFGTVVNPLFEADNLLDQGLMRKYLTNGAGIAGFPKLTLSPAGSAVLWLSVDANGAEPGEYEATLTAAGAPPVPVRVLVLDVTLPNPPRWVHSWSGTTRQFPFIATNRLEREVAYKQRLGITVWHGFPEEGTVDALARKMGPSVFYERLLPRKYVHLGHSGKWDPATMTDEDRAAIRTHVEEVVGRAEALGMGYDDWFGELWDEPGPRNARSFGLLARLVKRIDPNIRIYCNPSYWIGGGVADDQTVYSGMSDWYNDVVDISVPLKLLLHDHPQSMTLFDHERSVNAFYLVASHGAKAERERTVMFYRRMPWDAFKRGWNGWGFYSYHRPRGNSWNDFDASLRNGEDRPDYQIVYPGPRGPVPTRPTEAMRRGWDDYRLLMLLKQQGKHDALADLIHRYEQGEPLDTLKHDALIAAAQH